MAAAAGVRYKRGAAEIPAVKVRVRVRVRGLGLGLRG